MTKQSIVYLAGVVLLGLLYVPLKAATGGGVWFFLVAIGYLALLRLIGYGVTKRWPDRFEGQD
ncbi:MAG: hypothetical protein A3J25_10035 [Pseudomonadales bacterium RIFCSPLOWO2_02_FULL_63_210]|nr:MAG: hypothetical protein A3J25_10035 [Pseudomonadales bacterium RIFCSPLOWO2_02_FULL_63_210]